jgi:ribulose-phosphate 3-epimerase
MQDIQIYPSILAADQGRLAEECRRAESEGSDGLHIDIMDGQFVNNISLGFKSIEVVRNTVGIPLSVHLMIIRPDWYVERCVDFGAGTVLFHVETDCDLVETAGKIRAKGARAGLVLNPETPVEAVLPHLEQLDEVLCMTVHPGFGGQSFITDVLPKIATLREAKPDMDISVDGGINLETATEAARYGANIFLVGTSMFKAPDMAGELKRMRDAAREALQG